MPSVEGKLKWCDEDRETTTFGDDGKKEPLGNPTENVEIDAKGSKNVDGENECVWGVRGWCKTHKAYGKKSITTTKIWKQKKDGTFGNAYKKKTSYTCSRMSVKGDNKVTPEMVTLSATNSSNRARLLGVGKSSDGGILTLRVGINTGRRLEHESESLETGPD